MSFTINAAESIAASRSALKHGASRDVLTILADILRTDLPRTRADQRGEALDLVERLEVAVNESAVVGVS